MPAHRRLSKGGRYVYPVKAIGLFVLILSLSSLPAAFGSDDDNYIQAPGIIGVNSNISAGQDSINDLVQRAKEQHLKVIILTDQALSRGEYGVWPFRKLIRKVIEQGSILSFGAEKYLNLVNQAGQANPDIIIIPAADAAPFYYWSGQPFTPDFTVYDWSKQLLVIGLDNASDLKGLPMVANKYRPSRYGLQGILQLWPVLGLVLGIILFRRRKFGSSSLLNRVAGIVIIIFCSVCLVNNFPFTIPPEFNQYQGSQGLAPYQQLIDYVNNKNGMVFWSTPEAAAIPEKIRGVNVLTTRSPNDLLNTSDYTGFGAIYGDARKMHQPGREWDRLLREYCQGQRKNPPWAIGEADYHGYSSSVKIDKIQTVFLVKELTQKEVLDSLKRGRIYARANLYEGAVNLDRFTVADVQSGPTGYMGDEVLTDGGVNIKIAGSYSGPKEANITVQLIKNGERFQHYSTKESNFSFEITDSLPKTPERNYYRLIITSPYGEVVSNPIFVKCLP